MRYYNTLVILFLISTLSIISGCIKTPSTETSGEPIQIKVCDQNQNPVQGVKASIRKVFIDNQTKKSDYSGPRNISHGSDVNGIITTDIKPIPDSWLKGMDKTKYSPGYEVFIYHDKYSPLKVTRYLPDTLPNIITLETAVTVTLELKGDTVDGYPKIAYADDNFDAMAGKTFIQLLPVKIADNKWQISLAAGRKYVIGWISEKMYGYLSEPFTAADGNCISFSPGMPATLTYDLNNTHADIKEYLFPATPFITRYYINNGKETYISWFSKWQPEKLNKPGTFRIDGLAHGKYKIQFRTKKDNLTSMTPRLYDTRTITIESGQKLTVKPELPAIDTTIEPGDITINGQILDDNCRPLSNEKVYLSILNFDKPSNKFYLPAVSDQNGNFKFNGIEPGNMLIIKCKDYLTNLSEEDTAANTIINLTLNPAKKSNINVSPGQTIPDIPLEWHNRKSGSLHELKGKTVVIDYWSTYCKPCVLGLPHFNELAEKYAKNENIVFLALSANKNTDTWLEHLNKNKLNNLKHARVDHIKYKYYIGKPIPFTLIINPDGTIKAADNGLDIEAYLNI